MISDMTGHNEGDSFARLSMRLPILSVTILFLFLASAPALSQTSKPSSAADLAAYTGSDRERLLLDGAKREGKVVWYTTLAAEQNKQIAGAFETKISRRQSGHVPHRIVGAGAKTSYRGKGAAPSRRCHRNDPAGPADF